MRRSGYLIFASGWLLATLPLARGEDNTLQNQYLKIYLKINDGYQLEQKGDFRGALADFKQCYASLQRIHNSDPNWESALVIHRMDDCRTKILDLADRASNEPETVETPVPDDRTGVTLHNTADVAALKQRLTEVEQQLQDTKAKLQNSQLEASTLRTQLAAVNEQLSALKGQGTEDNQIGKLLSENKALTDKLTEARKEIASIKSPNPKSALSLIRAQLKNTQDQLDASLAANTALQQTTTTLRQQLDDAQADLSTANQRLAGSPPSSPEYQTLKRENEVMREILTRELQEQAHRDMAKRLMQEEFDRLKITSSVLREQLDILGSPMTPPNSEQERALLDGLRLAGGQVAPVPPASGNGFAVSNATGTLGSDTTGSPTTAGPMSPPPVTGTTNSPTAVPPAAITGVETNPSPNPPSTNAPPSETATIPSGTNAATESTSSAESTNSTNPPPVTIVNGNVPATPTTPAAVTPASTPAKTLGETSPTALANPTSAPEATTNSAETAAAPASHLTNAAETNASPSAPALASTTNSETSPTAPSIAATTNAETSATAPNVAATTNMETTPAAPTTNGATAQANPPATGTPDESGNQASTTNAPTTNAAPTQSSVEYSSKPRLPDDERDTAQQAADLFKMQRYDEAAAKYQDIIDKYPDSLYAWSNLGVVRFQQQKFPEALKALQRAVSLSPTDAFSYSNLGIVYYQMGQYENAISALERALALDPTNAKSHNYLGCACSQKGWSEVAEKEFTKAIELDDTFGDAHFNLALVYATEKPPSLEMARRHYRRALELGIAQDPRLEKLLGTASGVESSQAATSR